MIRIGSYMTARPVGTAPHEVYTVHARDSGVLGTVEWYGRWRQYVFQPEDGTVFSADCLRDLAEFVENCNRAQKAVESTAPHSRRNGIGWCRVVGRYPTSGSASASRISSAPTSASRTCSRRRRRCSSSATSPL